MGNNVEGFLLKCGALKNDNPTLNKFNIPNSGDYFKWKSNLHTNSHSRKYFFENALIFVVAWHYTLLPIVGILIVTSVLFFG